MRLFLPIVLFSLVVLPAGCCTAPEKAPPGEASVDKPLAETLPMDPSSAESPLVFGMPEYICFAEAQGISFVPDLPIDVFYYRDVWFWKMRGSWYWSRTYTGMLYKLEDKQVPGEMRRFGDTYRSELPDCREFTYDDWWRRMKASR